VLESFCDLAADFQRFVERQRPFVYALRHRLALDQFHDDEPLAVRFFQAVDGRDIRMRQ
jgi:hypothetical protein